MNVKSRNRTGYLFIVPYFVVFIVFSLFPIIYSFVLSFNDMDPFTGNLTFVGWRNYIRLIDSRFFWQSLWNTLLIWIMSIIPQLTLAFLLSLLLNNRWLKGRAVFRSLYYFPNLVTPVTIALLFGALFSYPGGTVNQVLDFLRIGSVDFSLNPNLARMVIAIAICWRNFGFNIIFFTAGLNSISEEILEAADVDGASPVQKVTRITIPLMRPILVFVLITSIIGGLQLFDESRLVFTNVPGNAVTTMVSYLYETSFERFQFGFGASVAYGIFVIILGFSLISFYITKDRSELHGEKPRRVRGRGR